MSDIAVVTLTGRVTADGQLAYTNSGTAMLKFSVACNRWKAGGKKTSFYDCVMWGKIAEIKERFAVKGQHVAVTGYIDIDEFEGKNGKVKKLNITVNSFEPTPGGNDGGQSQQSYSNNPYASGKREIGNTQSYDTSEKFDDDIPF